MQEQQGWPTADGVHVIAGTPQGGGQDRAARALAAAIGDITGSEPTVTNVPGRGGADAWERLVARRGDPGALSISSPTLVTNPMTGVAEVGVDDLTALATLCTEYIVFAVAASSPLRGPDDLLEALPGTPAPVTALATARGNVNHIGLAAIGRQTGADSRDLPVRVFDSAPLAIADTLAGNADLVAVSAASVLPEVGAGGLRPLGVTAPSAMPAPLDGVATFAACGIDCTIGTWRGVVAPPGIAGAAVGFWQSLLADAVATPSWRGALERHVWTDTYLDAGATKAFLADQQTVLGDALADLGLRRN